MPDLNEKFKEAWSQALVGLNAAESEAEKVLGRLADAAGLSQDDVKRHAREFGERLTQQRREVERAIEDGARRAAARFKVPSREEVDALKRRLDELAGRLEALVEERSRNG
jgi:polyhydroxyalkanoate synthesis regulator phasin